MLPPLVKRVVVREHVGDHRGACFGSHAGEAPDLEVKVHFLQTRKSGALVPFSLTIDKHKGEALGQRWQTSSVMSILIAASTMAFASGAKLPSCFQTPIRQLPHCGTTVTRLLCAVEAAMGAPAGYRCRRAAGGRCCAAASAQ